MSLIIKNSSCSRLYPIYLRGKRVKARIFFLDSNEIYKFFPFSFWQFMSVIIETMSLWYVLFVFTSWAGIGITLPEPAVSASYFHIHRKYSTDGSMVRKS